MRTAPNALLCCSLVVSEAVPPPNGFLGGDRIPQIPARKTSAAAWRTSARRVKMAARMSEANGVTAAHDPAREPIDFLPLRPWEVRKVRLHLLGLRARVPAPEPRARAIEGNVLDAHRAALAEYEAARRGRGRRSEKRREAITRHRRREVIRGA